VRHLVADPTRFVLVLAAFLALVAFALSRTTWRPAEPLRLARRRAWGQVLAASGRMYVRGLPLFLGIGLLFIPLSLLITLLQGSVIAGAGLAGLENEGESGGALVIATVTIGTTLTLLGLGVVQAATAWALTELDAGRRVTPVSAYRATSRFILPLLGTVLIAAVAISLLGAAAFLLPVAVWLGIRWAIAAPVVALEGHAGARALRRSARLVRGQWWKTASLLAVSALLALALGPLVGALLIVLTSAPFAVLNVVAGAVYAITMPFVALVTAYLYFDLRVRDERAADEVEGELPAEIELRPAG
jgi:hypothetical protein